MKPRTVILAGAFAQVCTLLLASAMAFVAFSHAIDGLMCCWASEREQ